MKYNIFKFFLLFFLMFFPTLSIASTYVEENEEIFNAKILKVVNTTETLIEWNNTKSELKELEVRILGGSKKGEIVIIESDFPGLKENKKISIRYFTDIEDNEIFTVININRFNSIIILISIFAVSVILLSGWQGVRALISLFASLFVLVSFLVPGILNGWNPLFASVLVATLILLIAIYFTHGFNRESSVAFFGTVFSIILTSLLAIYATTLTNLTGYTDDTSIYLNFNTQGSLDFTALLLGAMIIGIIGVLDDIAITQAAVVTELFKSNSKLKRMDVFRRAMRVGREHVSALVNTIVFAYVGAAFPLILLFSVYRYNFEQIVSLEIVATEIVRTIVGSIGLIMTVPVVTLLAVWLLKDYKGSGKKHSHSH